MQGKPLRYLISALVAISLASLSLLGATGSAESQKKKNESSGALIFIAPSQKTELNQKGRTTRANPTSATKLGSKQPQSVPCDCTNCSAEHCQPKGGGGGGTGGGWPAKWYVPEAD